MVTLKNYLKDFLTLIIPNICVTCGNKLLVDEKYMCISCLHELPRTNFHLQDENTVEQLFWGRVKVEKGTAWFYYRKGSRYQKIIHFLKYKGLKEIGEVLGKAFSFDLKGSSFFDDIDLIVPVPLHRIKERQRGYNQSEWIAKGMAFVLDIPMDAENLVRKKYTKSQTNKTKFERWENVEDIFKIKNPKSLEGKHILLVDDVVTTGSTLEASAYALLTIKGTKVSVATLASAMI